MLKNFDKTNTDNVKVISNFHTHNYLCGHAFGTVADYVKEAVANGYKTIGISDHFSSHNDREPIYIDWNTLESDYLPQFDEANKLYGDKIEILKGVEVAYYDSAFEYYRKLRDKLDYVVLGQHGYMLNGRRQNSFFDGNDEKNVIAYCNHAVNAIKTGLFDIFAHPDVICYNNPAITQHIREAFDFMIRTAVEHNVIVELNANGIRNARFSYPTDLLVEMCKKHNAKVVISSDCHIPMELCDSYVIKLYAYAKQNGLNVLDDIR